MLSQTAIYAIRALGYIAAHQQNQPILSREISEEMNIPHNYLSKIMNRLVQAGMLEAIRGTNGGFKLLRDPKAVSLREVAEKFMIVDDFKKCFLGYPTCDGSCSVHDRWAPLINDYLTILNDTNISEILKKKQT